MRKEFKFVRGLYTKKKLFDADIINDSFVILDEKGVEVSFDAEDDSKTQSQLINASSDGRVCKVYTITPDKITMEGNLEKEGDYKFTPTVKEIIDDDETIPENVKTNAETFLEEHLTADYTALTADNIGIGEGSDPDFVDIIFTDKDNNKKSFTRNMKFRVEGKVNKSSFVNIERGAVDPTETQVYVLNLNGDRYDIATGVSNTDLFIEGRKQVIVSGKSKYFPAKNITLRKSGAYAIADNVAHTYIAPNGYIFDVTQSEELPASEIGLNSGTTLYNLSIRGGNMGLTDLTFDISTLGVSNYIYADFVASADLYMIASSGNLEKITKNNYPYDQQIYTYDSDNYNVYNGSVYKNDSDDLNIYKVAGSPEETNVSEGLVEVALDNKTISPIHNFEKDDGYIITIDENKISITAKES